MSELALRLIEENKRTQDPFLDLGNCGLEFKLPKELLDCIWLEKLNLGNDYFTKKKWKNLKNRIEFNKFEGSELSLLVNLQKLRFLDLTVSQIQDCSFLRDLTQLQSLNLNHNQIQDYSFLQNLTQLQSLDLCYNQIQDISFLQNLTQLQSLTLNHNQIQDYSFLQNLTQLQSLTLSYNQIQDISFLQNLTQLQSLYLSYNQIQDIRFLQNLTQLQSLYLSYNQIQDIRFLQNLTQLQYLNLSSNQIQDYSFLQNLTQLQSLYLSSNQIQDYSFLQNLTQLQSLDLNSNQIQDISFLQNLTQLQSLYLSSNQIQDISFLQNLTQLQSLNLSSNQIQDISFLQNLTQLQYLNLSSNQIQDISFLQKFTQLHNFLLNNNQITEIILSAEFPQLENLYLEGNKISSISILADTPRLKKIHLKGSNISTINFAGKFSHLETLDLSNNQITEIILSAEFPQLENLLLEGNRISSISMLVELPRLKKIHLKGSNISTINFAGKFSHLDTLDLSNNQITEIILSAEFSQLQTLNLSSNQITEIILSAEFSQLQTLNLSNNQIAEIILSAEFSQLQTLDLSNNQIIEIIISTEFPALQNLNLENNRITEIHSLTQLSQLQNLNLSNNRISNISFLKKLAQLQTISLSNNEISGIIFLENLVRLQYLYLRNNKISTINFLEDLPQLRTLYLTSNNIKDIRFLKKMPQLQNLYLNFNEINNITFSEIFPSLKTLNLQANQILEIGFLEKLPELRYLNLETNQISNINQIENLLSLSSLSEIQLANNPLQLPFEIDKNKLRDLLSYIKDLKKGKTDKRFAKLLFLGDGCVGKTTLYKHLKYGIPPSDITPKDRTHGIALDIWEKDLENLKVNVWDFGGQEIFHGTHRLFLGQRAVYILVWTKQENKLCSKNEQHPLNYWLEFIADYGKESTVLLVENTIDGKFDSKSFPDEKKLEELIEEFKLKKIRLIPTHFRINCQKDSREVKKFKAILKEEIENIVTDYPIAEFPSNRLAIIEKLEEIKKTQKIIAKIDYETLCKKYKISNSEALLSYINKIGLVSYFPKLYEDTIILQTDWVLDAIYKALHPNDNFIKRTNGKVNDNYFAEIWNNFDIEEIKLFKSYMFKSELLALPPYLNYSEQNLKRPYKYLIPNLFPNLKKYSKLKWEKENSYWVLKLPFIYPTIMHRLQVKVLNICHNKEEESFYINYIAFIGRQDEECHIEVLDDIKEMRIWTDNPKSYIEVINLINEIYPLERIDIFERNTNTEDRIIKFVRNEGNTQYQLKDVEPLTEITVIPKDPIKVFVTYCWTNRNGDNDEVHQTKVHQLVNSLRDPYGFDATFDKYLNTQSTTNDFMRMMVENIYKCEKVIVVLSEGYAIKANDFKGGVGNEYQLIIKDIDENPNKYILVSFSGRGNEIYPLALRRRDTIDLSKLDPKEIENLIRKLEGSYPVPPPVIRNIDLDKPDDVGKLF